MSCDTQSWVNTTLEEAIDTLAKRASIARVMRQASEKRADMNQHLISALAGAGIGAGVGGASSMMAPKERRHTGRSMITGALSGAAIGGGGSMLADAFKKNNPQASDFGFSHKGQMRWLNPEAVNKSPALMKEVEQLQSRSPITQAVGGSWDFLKDYWKNHPILGTILGADAASHAVGTASNWVTKQPSADPRHFREGLLRAISNEGKGGPLEAIGNSRESLGKALATSSNDDIASVLAKARAGNGAEFGGMKFPLDRLKSLTDHGAGPIRPANPSLLYDLAAKVQGSLPKSWAQKLNITQTPDAVNATRLLGTGYDAAGAAKKGPFSSAMRFLNKGGLPMPSSRYNWMTRLGPRAALYAGIPAAQAYMDTASQESANNQRLERLIQQLSVPGK